MPLPRMSRATTALRRPRVVATVVLLTTCVALLGGCGDDETSSGTPDPSTSTGASVTEAPTEVPLEGATEQSAEGTDDGSGADGSEPTDGATASTPGEVAVPAGAEEVCAAMGDAVEAISALGAFPDDAADPVPPELVAVFHRWGDDLAAAEVPADFTDDQRAGLVTMAGLLRAVPDDATGDDLDDLGDDLDRADERRVESVTAWVDDTCNLQVF